jgi:hypothetical protein
MKWDLVIWNEDMRAAFIAPPRDARGLRLSFPLDLPESGREGAERR